MDEKTEICLEALHKRTLKITNVFQGAVDIVIEYLRPSCTFAQNWPKLLSKDKKKTINIIVKKFIQFLYINVLILVSFYVFVMNVLPDLSDGCRMSMLFLRASI